MTCEARTLRPQRNALCIAQSYVMHYFLISCTLWSSAIAYTLFAAVIRGQQLHDVVRRLPYMVLICQGAPLVSCGVCQLYDAFGDAGIWCWIPPQTTTFRVLRFATMYIPCWLCIVYNLFVYFSVRLRLRTLFSESAHWVEPTPTPTLPPAPDSLSSIAFTSPPGSYVELVDAPQPSNRAETGFAASDPSVSGSTQSSTLLQRDKLRKLSRRLMMYPLIQVLVRGARCPCSTAAAGAWCSLTCHTVLVIRDRE